MHRELLLRCDCSSEVMSADLWFQDGEFEEGYLTVLTGRAALPRFRDRIKPLWQILRGKDYYLSEVILKPEDRTQLLEFLHGTGS